MKSFSRIPIEYVDFEFGTDALEMVAEPENKKTVAITLEYLEYLESRRYRSGKTSLEVVEDQNVPVMTTFIMPLQNALVEEFFDMIRRLMEAGIKFRQQMQNAAKPFVEEVPALVLSMDDLRIGFIACLIPLALSAVVFIFEVSVPKIKILVKAMRDVLTAVYVIAAFLDFEVIAI